MAKKAKQKKVVNKKPKAPVKKHKFVLTVGDEGAILVLFNAGILEKRLFISSPSSQDLPKALAEHPTAQVSVVIDVLDQAFVQHTLPPVSPLAIGNLVKRRLEKDFSKDDIKAARRLFREKTGRKDWYYLFISLNYSPPVSEWIEAIIDLTNPFGGIYLLPLETEPYLKKIESTNNLRKSTKSPRWHILVSHNRVGGFRQIVFRDHKLVFTRIAQPIGGLAPDVIAGNIEQETLNTIEYIRRLGFENSEELEIYIICSQDVKGAIDATKLQGRSAYILTPHDVATKLGLPSAAEKTDRFGDVVFAAFFANNRKPVLRLTTPYSGKLQNLRLANIALKTVAAIIGPLLLLLSILNLVDIFEAKGHVDEVLEKKLSVEKDMEEIKKIKDALPAFSETAVDVVAVNQALTKEASGPLNFLNDFALLRTKDIAVKKVSLKVEERLNLPNKSEVTYFVLITNPPGGIDKLLESIDKFTESVRKKFRNYEVSFSGLPGEKSGGFSLELTGNNKGAGGKTKAKNSKDSDDSSDKSPFEVTIKGPIGESIGKKP